MKKRSIKKILFDLIVLSFLLTACMDQSIDRSDHITTSPESTGTATLNSLSTDTSEASTTTIPDSTAISLPTPTARVFREPDSCDTSIPSGHILFLQTSAVSPSGYDLYIMDGNACIKHLLMKNVSGSPAWSVDGRQISIGCEDSRYICILDAPASLNVCLKSSNKFSSCAPVVMKKYALPSRGSNMYIYNTSWSYDGTRLAVESGDFSGYIVYVDILTVAGEGNWQRVIEGDKFVHVEMSPIGNEIMYDGIYIMPLDSGPIKAKWYGFNGVWSHDGTKIAFLRTKPENEDIESIGIAEWNFAEIPHWRWLYEPQALDRYYWPPQNLDIGHNNYRILSWSMDGRFLAFVAKRSMFDSQIFRLDTFTGDVVVLTTKFEKNIDYYAPAWGP